MASSRHTKSKRREIKSTLSTCLRLSGVTGALAAILKMSALYNLPAVMQGNSMGQVRREEIKMKTCQQCCGGQLAGAEEVPIISLTLVANDDGQLLALACNKQAQRRSPIATEEPTPPDPGRAAMMCCCLGLEREPPEPNPVSVQVSMPWLPFWILSVPPQHESVHLHVLRPFWNERRQRHIDLGLALFSWPVI